MATVGIVSIFDLTNIGNRLQNFALYRALQKLGHRPVVIPNAPYAYHEHPELGPAEPRTEGPVVAAVAAQPSPESATASPIASRRSRTLPHGVRRRLTTTLPGRIVVKATEAALAGDVNKVRRGVAKVARAAALRRFTNTTMTVSDTVIEAPGDGTELAEKYDAFVVGSDQVWNPQFRGGCPTDFLDFAKPEQRIAYAASMGVNELDAQMAGHFERMLEDFPHISVREETAAEVIGEITDREVPVNLDPTMLLPADEWEQLADEVPPVSNDPYVATYLLMADDAENREAVAQAAAEKGAEVHDILAPMPPTPKRAGLEAFLRAIKDADHVVTDSFHATLFSIVLKTPVRVLRRGHGQDERIHTLLSTVGADPDAVFGDPGDLPSDPVVDEPDAVLADAREESLRWLEQSLESAVQGGHDQGPGRHRP